MNAKQQREWEDDVTQPCAFPEPLAEVLTRENRELRAEVERLKRQEGGQTKSAQRAWHTANVYREHLRDAEAELADATTAAQNLRDELQGAQERLRAVEALTVQQVYDAWWGVAAGRYSSPNAERVLDLFRSALTPATSAAALDAEP